MNDKISLAALIELTVGTLMGVVLLWRIFPWNIKKVVEQMREATIPNAEKFPSLDLEQEFQQVLQTQKTFAVWFLAFAALLVICATFVLVTFVTPATKDSQTDLHETTNAKVDSNLPHAIPELNRQKATPNIVNPIISMTNGPTKTNTNAP